MDGLPPEWHGGTLPPGTPAPRSEPLTVTCGHCGADVDVTKTVELGATWIDPEECTACGNELGDDILDSAREPERDWDQEMEARREREAMDMEERGEW